MLVQVSILYVYLIFKSKIKQEENILSFKVLIISAGIKPKVASTIYDRLDELAVKEHNKLRLGGEDRAVLAEIYPDCLTRLSPDTTDQPHVHRVLMMADTNVSVIMNKY